jgi:hypothetical protein
MLKNTIDDYLQNPPWLSEAPVSITQYESQLLPWLTDKRLGLDFDQTYQLTAMVRLKERDIAGTYYMQAIDLGRDGSIEALVITDIAGNIIEDFIFRLEDNTLSGQTIATKIRNREQRILQEILERLELELTRNNMYQLLELIADLKLDPFIAPLNLNKLELLKLLFNFGINDLKTREKIDFKKINFLLERLNNPWKEHEARTILQMVNNYEHLPTIKEAEIVFSKIGGIRNINLIIHRGKYHPHLISIVKEYDLDERGMIEAITETKKVVIALGL